MNDYPDHTIAVSSPAGILNEISGYVRPASLPPLPLSLLLCLLLCGFSGSLLRPGLLSAGKDEPLKVRVGYYDNRPKLFKGPDNIPQGIFPEILRIIADAENWQLEWQDTGWQEGLRRLEAGSIDIMPDVAYSVERAEKYTFTKEPVFINWGTLYTRPDVQVNSIFDLQGKRVAVMRGSIHTDGEEGIRRQIKDFKINCELIEFNNYQEVFQALQNNLADVGVVNRLFGAISQNLYDVQPTAIAFNPRHLKFAFPTNGANTAYLKEVIDHYLRESKDKPQSPIQKIITGYLAGTRHGVDTAPPGTGSRVYLTPDEQQWIREHPVITVGIDPEFAPFEFIDKNGTYSGFASDYINLLSRRLGLNMKIITDKQWTTVMELAQQKKIDLLPAIGFSRERTRFLSYTVPYIGFYRMVFSRNDAPLITGMADLKNVKVAVQENSSHADWIRENTDLQPLYFPTLQETIKAVADGTADAMIGNLAACTYWLRKLNLTNIHIDMPVTLQRQLLYMGVRSDWPQLVQILDKGLNSISAREHEEIRNRWLAAGYTVGISTWVFWQRMAAVVLVTLVTVALFWRWNRRLQREIQLRSDAEKELLRVKEGLVETVRKRTRELEDNKNYLQTIFNAPKEAIFVHDAETGRIHDVNDSMLKMFGIGREPALKCTPDDLSAGEPPFTKEEAIKKIRQTLEQGALTFEWLSRRPGDDTLFWTEVGLSRTSIADRPYVIAVVRDIDDRKRAEQVLAEEQERLSVTLRSIADGVISTDTEGKITLINKAAEQILGRSPSVTQGKDVQEVLKLEDEKNGQELSNPFGITVHSPSGPVKNSHARLICPDGTKKIISYSTAAIHDRESKTIGFVLVFRDVTRDRKQEEEILKIRKLESIGVLAGGIAHDFNNFLTAILGNMELASQLIDSEHRAAPLLDNAIKATTRAAKLTDQLLTFAKGGEPVRKTTSLRRLIRECAEFVLHGSAVSCNFDLPDDLWPVKVDSGQLSQVLQNMIINARHAMPQGGSITIKAANISDVTREYPLSGCSGSFIKVEIRDSGIGIPANCIDRIFDPYFSTKRSGSGLGLAICHSIINKHGGRVSVESVPGKGTTFTFYLPAAESEPAEKIRHRPEPVPADSLFVMIMDDDPMIQDIARSQLSHLGHRVCSAADGNEAINSYKKMLDAGDRVDVVIMDLTIPGGMGGKEAVHELLALDPDARVIVASGYSNDTVLANFKDYGFSAAISKPFNLHELRQVLAAVTSKQQE
jgi:PAS domain S-box-containing protein